MYQMSTLCFNQCLVLLKGGQTQQGREKEGSKGGQGETGQEWRSQGQGTMRGEDISRDQRREEGQKGTQSEGGDQHRREERTYEEGGDKASNEEYRSGMDTSQVAGGGASVGVVLGAIGETLVEIVQTTKDMVIGQEEQSGNQGEWNSSTDQQGKQGVGKMK